jgi:hypothetical protein
MTINYTKRTTPAPAPAISLTKMEATAPGLVDLYKHAGVSLQKKGLTGQRAAVYLVIDRSGSMGGYYRDGSVQHLAEQALGLSAQLDDDGIVPVVFFDHGVYPPVDVALTAYQGVIARENARLGGMGGTAYAPAMRAVIDHYQASGATDPAFVIFQTDGEPGDERETQQLLKDASSLPIFWQFVGFGRSFRFLAKLDTLRGRHVDNAGFFAAGSSPATVSDSELYDQLMAEYPKWLAESLAAGVRR